MSPLIVIADDHDAIRELLAELLEGEGYRVRHACDGEQALTQLRAERADLLITDQQMPRLTGVQVIACLPMRLGRKLPIILMSAMAFPPPLPRVIFLAKPFDLDQVMTLVRALLATPAPA